MTFEDPFQPMRDLLEALQILELDWQTYDYGRMELDGIQHVRRDGSALVITDQGGDDSWYLGVYTAEQFADSSYCDDALYFECNSTEEVIRTIVAQVTK
jgi:hypothetical protein